MQWTLLAAASLATSVVLYRLHLPAALLLGPMIVAVAFAVSGTRLIVGQIPFHLAQAIIGCLVASTLSPKVVQVFVGNWHLLLAVVAMTLLATSILGWLMASRQSLPGTTALWGLSAGAASAMVALADAHGADARLVAFMQYLRVALVATTASLVAGYFGVGAAPGSIDWFPAIAWPSAAATCGLVAFGVALGRWLKAAGGPLLGPMLLGALINGSGLVAIALPEWALAIAFTLIGWKIGLAFTRSILIHAARAFPAIVVSTLTLIAVCAGIAWGISQLAGVDPLTAYLAASPGGMDTIAAIAASSQSDMSFVMSFQSVRFFAIVAIAPGLIRFLADRWNART